MSWLKKLSWKYIQEPLFAWIRDRAGKLPMSAKEKIADWMVGFVQRLMNKVLPFVALPERSVMKNTIVKLLGEGNDEVADLAIDLLKTFKP